MRTGPVRWIALGALLAAMLALGGCAYTVVTSEVTPPKPGPPVHTGKAAVMDQVADQRSWPAEAPKARIPNVRIFAPEMTKLLRSQLLQRGLFSALPAPGDPAAGQVKAELEVTVRSFALEETGRNAWLVPHLLLDGVVLPVFTVVAVGTGGEIDLGGYVFPSTAMATRLRASLSWREPGLTKPVLSRDYLIRMPLGGVSQRQMREHMGDPLTYGVSVGKEAGVKAITLLAEQASRDPHWAYLDDYRRVAAAEEAMKRFRRASRPKAGSAPAPRPESYRRYKASPEVRVDKYRNVARPLKAPAGQAAGAAPTLAQMVARTRNLLYLLRPLAYTPEEVGVLSDGYLEPAQRAAIVNDIRARRYVLESPGQLPPAERLSAAQAAKLYDSPKLGRAQVEAGLVERVLALAVEVLTPRSEAPSAQAAALRQGLLNDLAARLKDKPRLQILLIAKAELAVKKSWPPMAELLKLVGSPLTQRYLASRGG